MIAPSRAAPLPLQVVLQKPVVRVLNDAPQGGSDAAQALEIAVTDMQQQLTHHVCILRQRAAERKMDEEDFIAHGRVLL